MGGKRTVVPVFRLYRQGGKYGVQKETGEKLKRSGGGRQAKRIFGNNILCAQFLRNYAGLPMLACVRAEDIEDITERYHLFKEVEFQSDTVKKVHVRGQENGAENDIYILSLIEHKSSVDYDVTMQILKYMVCIWENEAAEAKRTTMTSDKKDFRYLPIYPIVYYEGSGEWTAAESTCGCRGNYCVSSQKSLQKIKSDGRRDNEPHERNGGG